MLKIKEGPMSIMVSDATSLTDTNWNCMRALITAQQPLEEAAASASKECPELPWLKIFKALEASGLCVFRKGVTRSGGVASSPALKMENIHD